MSPFSSDGWDLEAYFEPTGSKPIHAGSISKCANFWRSFVKIKWFMNWIDHGYDLVWDKLPPTARVMRNLNFSLDNQDFVTKAVAEMIGGRCRFGSPIGRSPHID